MAATTGTDAKVFVDLRGKSGSTGTLQLDEKKEAFERGQSDEFLVKVRPAWRHASALRFSCAGGEGLAARDRASLPSVAVYAAATA